MLRIIFLILVYASSARSEESMIMPLGHNLDMTSYTLKKSNCTLGFQFAGCGVSNQFTLGTSPWLLSSYNSYNIFSRISFDKTGDHQRAFQFAYIKSYTPNTRSVYHIYEMELGWLSYIHSFFLAPHYTAHVNISAMYFINEKAPFSLRRASFYKDPFQLNLGVLNELHLTNGWYVNAEFAFLDAIKKYVHVHMGLSLEHRWEHWLLHLGLSQTQTFNALVNISERYDDQMTFYGYSGSLDENYIKNDYSIHPEVGLQVYF